MPKHCYVCESSIEEPIYDSHSDISLTSLCQLYPGATQVWFCDHCGHVQSNPLAHTEKFYASDYKILLNHEDEDQIYEVVNGKVTYRTDHQLEVLKRKLNLQRVQKILDYGCAKATMAKKLLESMPQLDFHFFDVSEMYRGYWERLTLPNKCAVNYTPPDWAQKFDLITSYFSLEHIPEIRQSVRHIASLLNDNGTFYAIVPDIFGNVADFVVVDHVNHFTFNSIIRLLQDAGFASVEIDDQSHRGALVIVACKKGEHSQIKPLAGVETKVKELARFWAGLSEQIGQAEATYVGSSAIYGSGFYGAFIYSHLKKPSVIKMFLDQSQFQQGRKLFEVPIIEPSALPEEIKTLYVGLNPKIARQVISSQPYFNRTDLQIVFMDAPV